MLLRSLALYSIYLYLEMFCVIVAGVLLQIVHPEKGNLPIFRRRGGRVSRVLLLYRLITLYAC